MNDIEALLRDSLQSAPMPATRVADPVASIERRAGRARAFIAAGTVAAVAIVTAAIVVPIQLVNRADAPGRVGPIASQPPTTSSGPQEWSKGTSQLVVAGDGYLWHLRRDASSSRGDSFVDKVNPVTHHVLGSWKVVAPADFMAYGLGRVWVWGGGDGAYPDGQLQVLDPADGSGSSLSNRHEAFNGIAFAGGYAWVTTHKAVWRLRPTDLQVLSSTILPGDTAQLGIAATDSGELWVHAGKSWVQIDPSTHLVVDTVSWDGWMLGPAGGDAIWTNEGGSRLIALVPSFLHQGQSVAEGVRIQLPGPATAVAGSVQTGLFVVAYSGTDLTDDKNAALYYLSPAKISNDTAVDDKTPSVPGAHPYQLAVDGHGGVDYSDQDSGFRWVP